jgi:competence protein ComEA
VPGLPVPSASVSSAHEPRAAVPSAYVPSERDLTHGIRPPQAGPSRPSPSSDVGRHARVTAPRGWFRLPAAFVDARWQPGRAAVLGVVVVGVLAVLIFGLRVLWASADAEGTVIAPGGGSRAGPSGLSAGAAPVGVAPSAGQRLSTTGPSATSGAQTAPSGSATAEPGGGGGTAAAGPASAVVVVHVVGQVKRPGVRELPAGSRVAQAVAAAGGAKSGADLSRVNLARVLIDGEQVRIPSPGDPVDPRELTGPGAAPGAGGGGAGGAGAGSGGQVALNSADLAALDTLPGVGPVLAQRILDWRTQHGRFTSVDELGEVSGIGEKLLAQLTPLVTL